ncbi:MAG: glycine oxidase ThiO [Deltaproteobacteria bacterium]|nr:glycine oxidase ThiO [Deltaproteobacteria bacterium]
MRSSTIIIGAGVTGLSIGWHLIRRGIPCLILEKGKAGGEASSAAAGMITPASEVRFGETDLLHLFLESLESYPQFVKELEEFSGLSVDFHAGSALMAIDHDDEAELLRLYDYQKSLGLPVTLHTPEELARKEPNLSHGVAALTSDKEFYLDNLLLIEALKKGFEKAGGKIREGVRVDAIETRNGQVSGVQAGGEILACSQVVLASGVHREMEGIDPGWFPLRPVKGQALELKGEPGMIRRAVRTVHRYPVYLVPRSDGRIIVGATSEEMGLDSRPTAGAVMDLLFGAWKALPASAEMELSRVWVGFRPTTPDHAPILGSTPIEGLHAALGMYRHGILLAPVVGKLMADWVAEEKESKYFETFGWRRFQKCHPERQRRICQAHLEDPSLRSG